jgi:Glycosyltransferase
MKPVDKEQHIFIIGCKGIQARYGGYETFVEKLTHYRKNQQIQYHVACAVDDISIEPKEFEYNGVHCFNIQWKKIGPARAIFYDLEAINWSIDYIKKNHIKNPIIYILACRIGPFTGKIKKRITKLGGRVFVNPDGHEWLRAKWSAPVRKYWKISERLMVKHADLLICDSRSIEKYILEEYERYQPNTTFIAYGAETEKSYISDEDEKLKEWYSNNGLDKNSYYLIVGRFVPENNYETMIREFMTSETSRDLALITNVSEKFFDELKLKTNFDKDPRIKFVGTVYNQELLKKIRENAYGYLHGHEVGGTNPSLLEALGSTRLNLLLDVDFNREVAEDGAIYWNKEQSNLADLINRADQLSDTEIDLLSVKARKRINDSYSWEHINAEYERVFLK